MMSEDLKAIFSQFRRLDAMAQVAGGRINDQAAITKQMTQLPTQGSGELIHPQAHHLHHRRWS